MTERSIQAAQYGKFLVSVFDEWVRRDVGRVFVQIFDVTLGAHLGQYSLCIFAPRCGSGHWRWNTTAICILAITTWSPTTFWETYEIEISSN